MLRYNLDSLGWYEFEGLVQTLLKARLGLGVEAWGGTRDWGRDAYFTGELEYPSKMRDKGPFLFQSKFVDSANAPGAAPTANLMRAVAKECEMIRERVSHRAWKVLPNHYVLLTNAPISPETRQTIGEKVSEVIPKCATHIHDGTDVCGWLDLSPEVARAFPQLLGLRDLEDLLRKWVNAEIITRSKEALKDAKLIAQVFVPTESYTQALRILNKHAFVVLEGPPEMGKTAIGRIISLTQVARGWEAIECRAPNDIIKEHKPDLKQVFIADDFFGRTEYEPSRVSLWQSDLPTILRMLDANHWLVLTSRAHLLRIAKANLDVGPEGRTFPGIGEVVVTASKLTPSEKARILYRHAKAANLPNELKNVVKEIAQNITADPHFTPERIRRLVRELLPEIILPQLKTLKKNQIDKLVEESLRDPTKGMKVSFRALSSAHRWLLFAIVEAGISAEDKNVKAGYERLCPESERRPYKVVSEELTEAFIRKKPQVNASYEWVHPSCRDLVIEEMGEDPLVRKQFLSCCSPMGIHLATSHGGGPSGNLTAPLLIDQRDWEACAQRCIKLARAGEDVLKLVLGNYSTIKTDSPSSVYVKKFEKDILEPLVAAISELSSKENVFKKPEHLARFYTAREAIESYISSPNVTFIWSSIIESTKSDLAGDVPIAERSGDSSMFLALYKLLRKYDPSFLRKASTQADFNDAIRRFSECGKSLGDPMDYCEEADSNSSWGQTTRGLERFSSIYEDLSRLSILTPEARREFENLSNYLEGERQRVEESAPEEYEGGYEEDYSRSGGEVDVDSLFKDL